MDAVLVACFTLTDLITDQTTVGGFPSFHLNTTGTDWNILSSNALSCTNLMKLNRYIDRRTMVLQSTNSLVLDAWHQNPRTAEGGADISVTLKGTSREDES